MKIVEQKISFNNSKGDRLCGILLNPTESKDKPVIILTHGFSTNKNIGTFLYLSEKLRENNISTFRFDFFGHGESEGKFENITTSEAVDDILNAIKHLKSNGYKQIGLVGSSFGGIASIMAASNTNALYLETKTKEELGEWKKKGYRYYVSGDGRKSKLNYSFFEDFKNNNGYQVASKIMIPTLIVHGDKDEIVPYKQSVKISKLIPDCILRTIKKANHRYEHPKQKEEMRKVIVNFIIKQTPCS